MFFRYGASGFPLETGGLRTFLSSLLICLYPVTDDSFYNKKFDGGGAQHNEGGRGC